MKRFLFVVVVFVDSYRRHYFCRLRRRHYFVVIVVVVILYYVYTDANLSVFMSHVTKNRNFSGLRLHTFFENLSVWRYNFVENG